MPLKKQQVKYPDLEKHLLTWINEKRQQSAVVDGEKLQILQTAFIQTALLTWTRPVYISIHRARIRKRVQATTTGNEKHPYQ